MKINIHKQDIPHEHREYIDSRQEAPDEVQVHEGANDGLYYDERQVQDPPDEYDEQEWEDNLDSLGIKIGDEVDVLGPDNRIYSGEITGVDGDDRGVYYKVEYDNGEENWISPANTDIKVTDPDGPEDGEVIELDQYEQGDRIAYKLGEDQKATVTRVDDDKVYAVPDGESVERMVGTVPERMGRTGTSDDVDPETLALATKVESESRGILNAEDLRNGIKDVIGNYKNDDDAKRTLQNIDKVATEKDKNAWNTRENTVRFKQNEPDQHTINHEYAHIFADANGYDYDPEGKNITFLAKFGVTDMIPYDFDSTLGELVIDSMKANLQGQDIDQELDTMEEFLKDHDVYDTEIEKEDFKLQKVDDDKESTEEVDDLIQSINESWDRIATLAEDNPKAAQAITPMRAYAATNAHELLAITNEIMQGGPDGRHSNMPPLLFEFPDIVDNYLDVIEPSDSAKETINDLHEKNPERSMFDDKPFDDDEMEGGVVL